METIIAISGAIIDELLKNYKSQLNNGILVRIRLFWLSSPHLPHIFPSLSFKNIHFEKESPLPGDAENGFIFVNFIQ